MTTMRLDSGDYGKVELLLDCTDFNTLFARTVVEGHLPGKVIVDDSGEPGTALIAHPYGMSLLVGDTENEAFNADLADYLLDARSTRKRQEWLQVHPRSWKAKLGELLGSELVPKEVPDDEPAFEVSGTDRVVELTRANFRFDRGRFEKYAAGASPTPHPIVRTAGSMFDSMPGQVIPRYFWRDADHFLRDGIGFTMLVAGEPAATAFCAFRSGNLLEMGIETAEGHRGRGYAEHVCHALIRHCLDSGLEPVWSCRLENRASYLLARKLGFVPTMCVPYYRLAVRQQPHPGPGNADD